MNILIVEDNSDLAEFLRTILEEKGNKVLICSSVEEVFKRGYEKLSHDIIILDLMLEGKGGETLIVEFKKRNPNTPILILSSLAETRIKVETINMGADDYLTKPFDAEELIVRLKALYRRNLQTEFHDTENFGEFVFFRKQHKIVRGKKTILLTKKEGEVFELLLRNHGKIVPLEDLIKLWNTQPGYRSNIIQSVVCRLRRKIDRGFAHQLIHTKHGIGYSLVLKSEA